ncbi:GNAT family N-acetyltransferase [Streptomyces sp. NPDC008086]|uniref:GNAT family N-acetyltransferase n=1 Tax=Streptomyces sp. NPDC008086 TaxID=3364807 RepID=UPI0036E064CD
MSAAKRTSVAASVSVRPLVEPDLDRADEIFRVAFGTFLGSPEPETFFGTADYVRTRWAADPQAAFAATVEGEVVGSNFAGDWGSVGYFGPLSVRPDLWDQGIGRLLMEPVMASFDTGSDGTIPSTPCSSSASTDTGCPSGGSPGRTTIPPRAVDGSCAGNRSYRQPVRRVVLAAVRACSA